MIRPDQLLRETDRGLWCEPGGFFIDPMRPAERALVTHGHADHARAGHQRVLATPETLAIMAARYGADFTPDPASIAYGERLKVGEVEVSFHPAGHVLGSAQIRLDWKGLVIGVSGDYKRRRDPTCAGFEVFPAHVYVSEATFALPVFRHPDDAGEIAKLLTSVRQNPDRAHLVGAYALGKAQRVICLLREAGYDAPIYIHGAMEQLCALYEDHGVALGPLEKATVKNASGAKQDFAGQIVIAPPSSFQTAWARRFPDPVICFASGWMQVRARARQRGVELPLILSDHADWDELTQTISDVNPEEVWITHGRDDALARWAELEGYKARPLSLVGYEDEDD
ncbi:ligase-associated DNA damage response exonuclease [Oceanicaulis sp. UBA2681]|uniref:ligase-associated DNA damage response exonuclease n=1 Tax=Oceanicaulis sp. UBA2681 TaxID=1947007 RepID=UPI000EBBABF0|nr:ligase-associated DNA damage response exonuclease [Oceanicaulis sp. UBA2681]HCR66904.1 ligase-associated DNA damage response exonuclease [Oceanicaulis sp.]|tara:strand:- start:4238 stop:5257 length:1020 start_codon:yes stop_codon:yes gene_type:complete